MSRMVHILRRPSVGTAVAAAALACALALPGAAFASKTTPAQPSVLEPDATPPASPQFRALLAKAQEGDIQAQNEVGICLATGRGVQKAPAEAVRWWTLAAEKGFADAQFNLALAYDSGHGVARNAAQAADFYKKAADQGIVAAMYNLAELEGTGNGVPMNLAEAAHYYEAAAQKGHAHSLPPEAEERS